MSIDRFIMVGGDGIYEVVKYEDHEKKIKELEKEYLPDSYVDKVEKLEKEVKELKELVTEVQAYMEDKGYVFKENLLDYPKDKPE